MAEIIKTFQECLKLSEDKRHLMLGNGFSAALFPKIFNYQALKDKISSTKMQQLFDGMHTTDFEFVMRRLHECLEVIHLYPETKNIQQDLRNDLEELKQTLIQVISECHPESPSSITDQQYLSCRNFLYHFNKGRKYTFNYDILLYWVYMHFLEDDSLKLQCDDGFRTDSSDDAMVTWEIGQEKTQTLYYVHGAMHIFSDGNNIEKYNWKNTGLKIKDQVQKAIDCGIYPVFISEGSDKHKRFRINRNAYLARSMSSLKSIQGDLFIFGHSLRFEDDHIFNLILKNPKINRIFISIFQPANNSHIYERLENWRLEYDGKPPKRKEFILYDAESAKVWS